MRLRVLLVGALFVGGVVAEEAAARSKRVRQVPNGSAASCNTCHVAGGGSPLNPFGLEILTNFLTAAGGAGDVIWDSALAALDSDGDGASNGAELGDPAGTWVVGDPNPEGTHEGDAEEDHDEGAGDDGDSMAGKVFNPGDPESTPPLAPHDTAVEETTWARIKHRMGGLD